MESTVEKKNKILSVEQHENILKKQQMKKKKKIRVPQKNIFFLSQTNISKKLTLLKPVGHHLE